jgi:hypothetical protein
LRDESGNSESALVLIPLLSLFLIISQVSIAIHTRNIAKISVQDEASSRALSGSFEDDDTFLHIYSPDKQQNLDLVISHSKKSIISIFPGLQNAMGRSPNIDVTGIAVVENQR